MDTARVRAVYTGCSLYIHGRVHGPYAYTAGRLQRRPCTRALYTAMDTAHVHSRVRHRVYGARAWPRTGPTYTAVNGRVHGPYTAVNTDCTRPFNVYKARMRNLYTVNHKKRDILFLTITLANLNRFL